LTECLNLPEGLVTAIHNPIVDQELHALAMEPVDHPWFKTDSPVVLAVGRLVAQKDYPLLLRAFSRIRRKLPARLIILGEGEQRGPLERLARDLNIRQDVDFPGFTKNPFPFMRQCTVFVLSSRFEGLPGALIQAMACGAPAISTDCPSGPSEVIENGTSGILVPVGDEERLAAAMEGLLTNATLRESLSAAGRAATAAFDVQSMIKQYEDALLSANR
jgi:glycosyltransferase involved in cell wall biosynthesis